MQYIKLYKIFVRQYFKQLLEYKLDFIIGILGIFVTQCLNIVFLWVIFSKIPSLYGWNLDELIFIYGFSLIPKGLDHLLTDNLWIFAKKTVVSGQFDKYLLRPISPLFQITFETFQFDAVGEILIGVLLLIKSFNIVYWTPQKAILFILTIPFTTLIYTSLKIMTASISFWTKKSGSVMYIFYMINNFAKYPVNIYNFVIRFVITFIIPFAFTAFYPASFFIRGENNTFFYSLIMISILFFLLSLFIWKKGISSYESSGS
ncbi:ABC-2 type transport system permease protein [Lactobacillus colini]|uniref:ABC-2 type transport system permease protein n=1 Tax=Lactobacillus colini TaxID=1819254 RepID=A0ABS4MDR1_9LACO|nr:ABC-2 family transporter protein [Lactobacillus colini]MBP2057512.1 ABC-2 type transport system permease protein [Lactobacillus colini]